VDQLLSQLTPQGIASLTGYPFILNALSVIDPFKSISHRLPMLPEQLWLADKGYQGIANAKTTPL
jgi:hypothetical protein